VVSASVMTALQQLLAERGSERITIPMVAQRAGVNPTTLYRRWGDMATMVNSLATYRPDEPASVPVTGDLRADVRQWAAGLVEHYRMPANAALLRAGAASAGAEESDCLRNRRSDAAALAARYEAELAVTADQILNHVAAPIVYRVIFMPWTLTEQLADEVADELLALIRPRRAAARRRG
jgi:AcrR family transcriptional regulator